MLDSEELRASPRSRDFLAYVVTEALAGRGHRLKERTVARYALGRTKDFDSVTDAAARVQANRLRASMERYYAGTGAAESLVIDTAQGQLRPDVQVPGGHPGAPQRPPISSRGWWSCSSPTCPPKAQANRWPWRSPSH